MIEWQTDICEMCHRVASLSRDGNEHLIQTMMSHQRADGTSYHMHLACKEVVQLGFYTNLNIEDATFALRKFGFLT